MPVERAADHPTFELAVGDTAIVPIGTEHFLEAGPAGVSIMVTMLAGTRMIRADGSEAVPAWVG